MLDALIGWSLRHRAVVIAASLLLLMVGGAAVRQLPIDVFPDLTAPTVTVLAEAHGMAPLEVERQITFPIETALNGAAGVRRVRSATVVGIAIIWVEFEWDVDPHVARQTVAEKLSLVADALPPEAERPILAPASSIMGEILFLGLTSDRHDGRALRLAADTRLRRRLLAVPGVAQVTTIGGAEKQCQALLAPDRLVAHGITLHEILEALSAANRNVSAGFLDEGGSEHLVTGVGRLRSVADVAATNVAARDGVAVRVSDLGRVVEGDAPRRGTGSVNGEPGVVIGVQKQPGVNTLKLTRELDRVLDDVERELPEGMVLHRDLFRQADFIGVAVRNVATALRDGAGLVVVIVGLFLLNLRATFITLTALPLSLLAAVAVLHRLGESINTMTLGGLAIAIGALVDDAIIDVENVFRRLRENARLPEERRRPALDVVFEASVEVRASIVFATLVIVLVFVPLFFLEGVEGRLLRPLGVAYVVGLIASLGVAVTVTPVLCLLLLPKAPAVRSGHEPRGVAALKRGYGGLLARALEWPWIVAGGAAALLVAALLAVPRLGLAFLPEFNEGALTIAVVTLPGTSLAESDGLGRVVERTLLAHPEVVSTSRRTGRAELDEHGQGVEAGEIDVALRMKERGREEFLAALRADLSLVPGVNVTIGQPISHRIDHMLSGTRASIAVKVFGDDLAALRQVGARVRDAMQQVPGVVDLALEAQMEVPAVTVRFDREALGRHGVRIEEIAHSLEAALAGVPVTRILDMASSFDVVVRLDSPGRLRPDQLGGVPIDTPSGARVPLRALARVMDETAPNTVSREQVQRKIVVSCNVAGRDVASVADDCRRAVEPIVAAAPGHRFEIGGQFESAVSARRRLLWLGAAILAAIGFLLHLAFGSARDAALVLVNLPLALVGGVLGVLVSGGVLSIASFVGFIAVFGIATRNGIMLVSHVRHLREKEGVADFREAVHRGACERLVPILMTALAAGLALLPVALSGDAPGNEIQKPMAIVMLFGLLSSMVLNMFVVPALYLRLGRRTTNGGAS
jgi:CzcA family heavy metal efflux pump